MDFETDSDRLALLVALGAVSVSAPGGTFTGLVDREYVSVGELGIEDISTRITARSSDLERVRLADGDSITAAGLAYIVRAIKPDGVGMSFIDLQGP
jgi:hypothetical protein